MHVLQKVLVELLANDIKEIAGSDTDVQTEPKR